MTHRDVRDLVVIGASAGGVEALRELVSQLPAELPAAVLVVLHVPASGTSALPTILSRAGRLPAAHAVDGEPFMRGRIYVAPPDQHLLLRDQKIALARGPRENGHRPAVDALFRSAAREFGPRVVAVVLSGALDDGAAGAVAVRGRGGAVLVQDPEAALNPGMPRNALAVLEPDGTGTATDLGRLVASLAGTPAPPGGGEDVSGGLRLEAAMADVDPGPLHDESAPGAAAGFGCPDCHGSLFDVGARGDARFRCRVGHAWTAVGLLAQQDTSLEKALWMALRSLEDKVALCRRMAVSARERGNVRTAERHEETAQEALQATGALRALLLAQPARVGPDLTEPAGS